MRRLRRPFWPPFILVACPRIRGSAEVEALCNYSVRSGIIRDFAGHDSSRVTKVYEQVVISRTWMAVSLQLR